MVNSEKSAERLPSNSCLQNNIDGCLGQGPAAGWRNSSDLNNRGENGNYWSGSPNESNSNNAYNLNFNDSNVNVNWNNRNNGHSVRGVVPELTTSSEVSISDFVLTREQLLVDLYQAYRAARKNKRGRVYQLQFEFDLENNLVELCDELIERRYVPRPSTCFVIHDPKMREVFAAEFRDRIVHHLFYNYTAALFERTFIADTYSCIKGRGTHYGIERLKHHISSVSAAYTRPCYVMKLDIRGYFMHIDRVLLREICRETLGKMRKRRCGDRLWAQLVDFEFVDYLLEMIINTNPLDGCRRLGDLSDWDNLPKEKSLFCSAEGCGLPIGNLSSQLFSNVYMNRFDQFMKRKMGCKHYGRYVDDAYVVAGDRLTLKSMIAPIREYLSKELHLELNMDKLQIHDAYSGVDFLGAYIRPYRTYVSASSLRRMRQKLYTSAYESREQMQSAINSFLGVMSHYDSYRMRRVMFGYEYGLQRHGGFSPDWLRFRPFGK